MIVISAEIGRGTVYTQITPETYERLRVFARTSHKPVQEVIREAFTRPGGVFSEETIKRHLARAYSKA